MSVGGYLKKIVKSGSVNWQGYEKKVAQQRGAVHKGGPGKPDYVRGSTNGEVKFYERPLTKYDVMTEARKGRNEIVSLMGFNAKAIEYANRYRPRLRLIDHDTIVKPRKRGW